MAAEQHSLLSDYCVPEMTEILALST